MSDERFPRLVLSRGRRDGAAWVGPYGSRETAQLAAEALAGTFHLRTCTQRLTRTAAQAGCALAEMGRCLAPCRDGTNAGGTYAEAVDAAVAAMTHDPSPVVAALAARMAVLAAQDRFEEAATIRDRSAALVAGVRRRQRLDRLTSCAMLVAAARRPTQGWDVVAIANGRLRATSVLPPRQAPAPYLDALTRLATAAPEPDDPSEATAVEEIELLLAWLERPGTRLIEVEGTWACAVTSAERLPDQPGSTGGTTQAPAIPPQHPAAPQQDPGSDAVPPSTGRDGATTGAADPAAPSVPVQPTVPAQPAMAAGRL
jgi:DNA polymerase-3 subunit epsilon